MAFFRLRLGAARFLALCGAVALLGAPAHALASSSPSGGAGLPPLSAGPSSAGSSSGGASSTGTVSQSSGSRSPAPPPSAETPGHWLSGFAISEYWAAPESWFVGRLVSTPGLPGKHRIDWLYSARGVSMNGEGIGLDGRMYHVAALGSGGWVTAAGRPTNPATGWTGGAPYWRSGGFWRNQFGGVTFPLQSGGWSAGSGRSYVSLPGVRFAAGPSLPLRSYQSIAVDPRVIPFGSLVYIPAYRNDGHGGWFVAQDTGGAIVGHRIDVYRTPPATPDAGGQYLLAQRVFVVKAGS